MKKQLAAFFLFALVFSSCKKERIELLIHEIDTGNDYQLYDVSFLNDSIGFISGGKRYEIGVLLKTREGGNTWTAADSVIPKASYCHFFFNEAEGCVAGYDSWYAATADSGKTFSTATAGNYRPINDIAFYDRLHGVRVQGDGYTSGYIAYTEDGGNTWRDSSYINNMRAVQYTDAQTVFACGYGVIYKSTDGGKSFFPLDVRGDFFTDLDFPTATTGYFAGYQGMILKTTDAGSTFKKIMHENTFFEKREHFEAIKFWNENVGYAIGDFGLMYATDNGGDTWKKVSAFTDANLRDLHLFSANTGVVVGDEGKVFLFQR